MARPRIKDQREIREQLQKFLPDVVKTYEEIFKLVGRYDLKEKASKEILAKLIPDLKTTELTGTEGAPIEIKIIKDTSFTIEEDDTTTAGGTADTELSQTTGDI